MKLQGFMMPLEMAQAKRFMRTGAAELRILHARWSGQLVEIQAKGR